MTQRCVAQSTLDNRVLKLVLAVALVASAAALFRPVMAQGGTFIPTDVVDQTPSAPLPNPNPLTSQPRYLSGFGADDAFTLFYEDRTPGPGYQTIYYNTTTTGPTGLASASTATNIVDTHFVVKDWPIDIGGTTYAYRGWGSVGNNLSHHFYVSNDLTNWTLVSTFTISNDPGFTDARGLVYYGFHDVIDINGTYYAWAETNQSQTGVVRSANGDDVWEAFAAVGGAYAGASPLNLMMFTGISGPTPTGNFIDLGHNRGYGKLCIPGDDSAVYLAINTAARASLPPDQFEAAFIDPNNWTWHDGTTGVPTTPLFVATAEHDWQEVWAPPQSDPDALWMIVYTADYGAAEGRYSLGYATLRPPPLPPSPPSAEEESEEPEPVAFTDPAISKAGSPAAAAVGEPVTWTVDVWNPGPHPTDDFVFVRDFIPDMFDIVRVTTTRGGVTVTGQEVQVAIGALAPGKRAIITIETVGNDLATAGEVCNTASADWNFAFTATACVMFFPDTLPATGGTLPDWVWWGVGALIGSGAVGAGWLLSSGRATRRESTE